MDRESRINVVNSGMSLSTILTAAFIVLRVFEFINWPWIWVLSPIWISMMFVLLILGVNALVLLLVGK